MILIEQCSLGKPEVSEIRGAISDIPLFTCCFVLQETCSHQSPVTAKVSLSPVREAKPFSPLGCHSLRGQTLQTAIWEQGMEALSCFTKSPFDHYIVIPFSATKGLEHRL